MEIIVVVLLLVTVVAVVAVGALRGRGQEQPRTTARDHPAEPATAASGAEADSAGEPGDATLADPTGGGAERPAAAAPSEMKTDRPVDAREER